MVDLVVVGRDPTDGVLIVSGRDPSDGVLVVGSGRYDVGGSLTPIGADAWSVALFDTVSGGAGHVLLVEEKLDLVLAAALRRVSTCECGPETSCYGCLRSYGNQRDHDELSRGAAEQILTRLLAGSGTIDQTYTLPTSTVDVAGTSLDPSWAELHAAASTAEQALLLLLGDTGTLRPELGFERCRGHPGPAGLAGSVARCRRRARRRRSRRPEG